MVWQVDSLSEEVAKLKAAESLTDSEGLSKEALEKQMETHRELHQKQVAQLRQEINTKQALVEELKEWVVDNPLSAVIYMSRNR